MELTQEDGYRFQRVVAENHIEVILEKVWVELMGRRAVTLRETWQSEALKVWMNEILQVVPLLQLNSFYPCQGGGYRNVLFDLVLSGAHEVVSLYLCSVPNELKLELSQMQDNHKKRLPEVVMDYIETRLLTHSYFHHQIIGVWYVLRTILLLYRTLMLYDKTSRVRIRVLKRFNDINLSGHHEASFMDAIEFFESNIQNDMECPKLLAEGARRRKLEWDLVLQHIE
jgi:hypothetical protein